MNYLLLFLGQIPEAIYFALFIIFTKNLRNYRVLFSIIVIVEYYLCMNMFYNDFKAYPEAKRLDINEFCLMMSKHFINDVDAPKYKVEKYFKMFE